MKLTEEQKKKFYQFTKIIRNSAKCLKCNEEIESTYRHDFRRCSCGTIFVDGGKAYLRRGGDFEFLEDTSVPEWWDLKDVNNELDRINQYISSNSLSDFYETQQELLLEYKKLLVG